MFISPNQGPFRVVKNYTHMIEKKKKSQQQPQTNKQSINTQLNYNMVQVINTF